MLDFLKSIYYEFLSYFVPEKMEYEITGECKKCGKCCNYMYSFDTYTPKEFKIMQFLYPAYKRFYIKGKDKEGNLIFACKYVTKREFTPYTPINQNVMEAYTPKEFPSVRGDITNLWF